MLPTEAERILLLHNNHMTNLHTIAMSLYKVCMWCLEDSTAKSWLYSGCPRMIHANLSVASLLSYHSKRARQKTDLQWAFNVQWPQDCNISVSTHGCDILPSWGPGRSVFCNKYLLCKYMYSIQSKVGLIVIVIIQGGL